MACNREPSAADGTTSSATPVCQNPDARVPCCNNNCHFFGCAATMNFCAKCYSEHILKEGGVFLNKPCDAPVDSPVVRSNAEGADEANDTHIGIDNSTERIVDASPLGGSTVDTSSADASGLRQVLRSKDKSSSRSNMMHTSAGVSDLRAVFGLVETSSSGGDMFVDTSDLRRQRIPSPLSLSSGSPRAFSPVRRQVETKLLPPLPPRQQAVNRCLTCRKRIGLLGFKCRCGDIFCAMHRYSDKHDCSFDYKAAGRAAIAKENPIVKASKIERI